MFAWPRRRTLGAVIAVTLSLGILLPLGFPRTGENEVQGKTPKQWAKLLTARPTQHLEVLPSLCQTLVPHLVQQIKRYSNPFHRDTGYWLTRRARDYFPENLRRWVPDPVSSQERKLNAVILLGVLGPCASEAVPVLISLLDDEELCTSAVLTLQAIGPAARAAVPKMLRKLSEEPEPRLATALAHLAPDDPEVIRALLELSRTEDGSVRLEAEAALKICTRKLTSSLALLNSETAEIEMLNDQTTR